MHMEVTHAQEAERMLGMKEAAKLSQLSADTLRRAAQARRIPSSRTPGGHLRFRESDILALTSVAPSSPSPGDDGAAAA